MVARITDERVQGRAPSWIATISAAEEIAPRPFHTESCRSLPPTVKRNVLRKPDSRASSAKASCIPARTTTTISWMQSARSKRSHVCATSGRPATSRKSLSTFGPMRVPRPAATMMAAFMREDCGARVGGFERKLSKSSHSESFPPLVKARWCSASPNGAASSSPGLRGTSYPG